MKVHMKGNHTTIFFPVILKLVLQEVFWQEKKVGVAQNVFFFSENEGLWSSLRGVASTNLQWLVNLQEKSR